ncbi:hypothetical protein ACTXT7_012717 [Hymenolepis weldensis]
MIGSLASVDEFSERNQDTDSSSTSSANSKVQKPPITHNYSIQSQYCFEEARQREANNAQKLLNLPVNNKQFLVAKGILTKICRKKPKQRTFYLFNDSLVYANISYGKLLAHPHAFKLEEVTITDVSDSGIYRHGFTIETPKKSFTVYASLAEEKRRWVESINQYAEAARQAAGKDAQIKLSLVTKSPVWIPNSEATHCMVCSVTEFTLVQRRTFCFTLFMGIFRDVEIYYFKDRDIYKVSSCILLRLTTEHMNMILNMWHQPLHYTTSPCAVILDRGFRLFPNLFAGNIGMRELHPETVNVALTEFALL